MSHSPERDERPFIQVPIYLNRADLVLLSEWMSSVGVATPDKRKVVDAIRLKSLFDDGVKVIDGDKVT